MQRAKAQVLKIFQIRIHAILATIEWHDSNPGNRVRVGDALQKESETKVIRVTIN